MSSEAQITTDHDTIRKWAEARGGKPSHVKATANDGDPGILRIDFPGYTGEQSLEQISWEKFFEKFEEAQLAFLYQERTIDGDKSRFNKLVTRDGE